MKIIIELHRSDLRKEYYKTHLNDVELHMFYKLDTRKICDASEIIFVEETGVKEIPKVKKFLKTRGTKKSLEFYKIFNNAFG